MVDYGSYKMNFREHLLYTILAGAAIFTISYIFYRSLLISVLFLPLALLYPRIKVKKIILKRKNELNIQFKDMLYSLSSSISAGKTVEGAFGEALTDLAVLYPDPSTYILEELRLILGKIDMNDTIESALINFASRAGLEDVDNFVSVLNICKRSGGNLTEVIKNTSSIINDKIEVGQEINVLLAERKFEQKVLNVLPVAMILLLSASAPDYMRPVFTTGAGRIAMSASIALLSVAWLISAKISCIKV